MTCQPQISIRISRPSCRRLVSHRSLGPDSWTPLSSGPAPRAIPSLPAPSSASSVVSSSSYASMMSGSSLPARAPFATMDFNAAAASANSSIARAAPFEKLRLAYTGGASDSSSPSFFLVLQLRKRVAEPHPCFRFQIPKFSKLCFG